MTKSQLELTYCLLPDGVVLSRTSRYTGRVITEHPNCVVSFFDTVHLHDLPSLKTAFDAVHSATDEIHNAIYRRLCRENRYIWLETKIFARTTSLSLPRKVEEITVVERDVSDNFEEIERLAIEREKYSGLIDNQSDVIYCLNAHGQFEFVSITAYANWGYTQQELLGRSCWEMLVPNDRQLAESVFQSCLQTGQIPQPFVVQRLCKNMARLREQIQLTPRQNSTGRIFQVNALSRKVTTALPLSTSPIAALVNQPEACSRDLLLSLSKDRSMQSSFFTVPSKPQFHAHQTPPPTTNSSPVAETANSRSFTGSTMHQSVSLIAPFYNPKAEVPRSNLSHSNQSMLGLSRSSNHQGLTIPGTSVPSFSNGQLSSLVTASDMVQNVDYSKKMASVFAVDPALQPKRKYKESPAKVCCQGCNVQQSLEWRKGPDGLKSLCNACGLRYARSLRATPSKNSNDESSGDQLTSKKQRGSKSELIKKSRSKDGHHDMTRENKRQRFEDVLTTTSPSVATST